MRSPCLLSLAATCLGASALQLQRPMQLEPKLKQAPLSAPKPDQQHLPLIDSEELQSLITSQNLHSRAKELYEKITDCAGSLERPGTDSDGILQGMLMPLATA